MKNAQLWKRVLHEGISHKGKLIADPDSVTNKIITTTLIVGPSVDVDATEGEACDWPKYRLVCPFEHFWVERQFDRACLGFLVLKEPAVDGVNWFSVCNIMASDRIEPFMIGFFSFGLKSTGDLLLASDGTFYTKAGIEPSLKELGYTSEQCSQMILTHAALLFDVLGLLNCKNVSLSPRDNEAKQIRIASKRHGSSGTGYRYHVLTVRPPAAKSDSPGVEIGSMPQHVCRGHFAEYGPEFGKGLLFGRISGRFFIPPHVRGDKKNGIVEKDYEVQEAR